jgi:hypothetical protein
MGAGVARHVAELAIWVIAPASTTARRHQGASVVIASCNGLRPGKHIAHRRGQAIRRGAVAELAVLVIAPASNATRCHHCASMTGTQGNGLHAHQRIACGWGQAIRRRTVAELTGIVTTPAANTAGCRQNAGVLDASSECFGRPFVSDSAKSSWAATAGPTQATRAAHSVCRGRAAGRRYDTTRDPDNACSGAERPGCSTSLRRATARTASRQRFIASSRSAVAIQLKVCQELNAAERSTFKILDVS